MITSEDFLQGSLTISYFYDDKYERMCCFSDEVQLAMVEFAKLHVELALKVASEKFDHYSNKNVILNSYPLNNIK